MQPPNYLEGVPNPFNLAGPPAWFRAELAALDADLVLFPSQEEGVYRVARRVAHGHLAQYSLRFIRRRPDTKTYVDHSLAPVTSLLPFVQWGPVVLSDLAEMDMRRFGGADKVADLLEAHEASRESRVEADIKDRAGVMAADYYRTASYTTGSTVYQMERRGAQTKRRRPTYQPPNFAGGSAVILST